MEYSTTEYWVAQAIFLSEPVSLLNDAGIHFFCVSESMPFLICYFFVLMCHDYKVAAAPPTAHALRKGGVGGMGKGLCWLSQNFCIERTKHFWKLRSKESLPSAWVELGHMATLGAIPSKGEEWEFYHWLWPIKIHSHAWVEVLVATWTSQGCLQRRVRGRNGYWGGSTWCLSQLESVFYLRFNKYLLSTC